MGSRGVRALGPALLLSGLVLFGVAIARGPARLDIVVIVPVLTSSSPLALLGVLLLFVGVLFLPLSFAAEEEPGAAPPGPAGPPPGAGAARGGVLLVGPVPVFFGDGKRPSRRSYWLAVLAGSLALGLLVAVFLFVR